jgi:hypothetical protein
MKSLFERLFNKKRDQKTFNLSWMDGLSTLDEITALQTVINHLTMLANESELSPEQRMLALMRIDEGSQRFIFKVTTQYIKFDHLRPDLEEKFWETAYYYYRNLFTTYFNSITNYPYPGKSPLPGTIPMETMIWSCLHAGFMMCKWRYFKLLPAPDKTWLQIFILFKIAEQEALLEIPVKIGEEEPGSSISALFIQACMLDSLLEIGMPKNHVEATQQLLRVWLKNSHIHKNNSENKFLYYVDITKDRGARRIRDLKPTPDFRFLDTDSISEKISNIQASIAKNKSLEKYGLGEISDSPILPELLQQLDTALSKTTYRRQRRKEKRTTISKPVIAVYGMENVCKLLRKVSNINLTKGTGNDRSFEERLASHHVGKLSVINQYFEKGNEQWIIVNESEQGFGAVVNSHLKENIKVENLVGLLLQENHNEIIVGIIKNIKPLTNNQLRVGICISSRKAHWVEMSLMEAKPENQLLQSGFGMNANTITSLYPDFSAIYLEPENGISETASLLIPRLEFQQQGFYQITIHGENLTMQLNQILDAKNDWVRVKYPLPPFS